MKIQEELHKQSLDPNINKIDLYNDWANTYDRYVDSLDYKGPENIVKYLTNIKKLNKNINILDFGCGTGKIGEYLQKTNLSYFLEGIDISENMLKIAKEKNCYNKLTNIDLTRENISDKYDIILSSGVFLEGHVNICNINKLYKLLNKNGIILFTIRESFKEKNNNDFLNYVENNKNFCEFKISNIEYLRDVKCKLVYLKS